MAIAEARPGHGVADDVAAAEWRRRRLAGDGRGTPVRQTDPQVEEKGTSAMPRASKIPAPERSQAGTEETPKEKVEKREAEVKLEARMNRESVAAN